MEQHFRPRFMMRLLAGLACVAATVPAHAQSLSPSSVAGLSKTEAILGGAPSRLASILSAQANGAVMASAFAAALPGALASPRPGPFGFESEPTLDLAASPDRPDVFNSVALPIARTPLDERWRRAASSRVFGRAASFATSLRGQVEHARIAAVNAYVNSHVAFVDDSRQYGVADRWSPAAETLARGRGDCEDYALAKMAMLRRAGFADKDLYLVVLKDLVRRADHAVLVVRSEGHFLVLDNGTDRLLNSAEIRDYRPILTFAAGHRYTHGYRRGAVPLSLAMAAVEQPSSPVIATIATAAGLPSSPFAAR